MAGVYVSYPFCRQKCSYCNFASGVMPESLAGDYLAALGEEIRGHGWEWTPETVYLGGGSPDLIDAGAFRSLMESLPGAPWREGTLEAAPGCITDESAELWAACGIDRVSLGVQSFVESEIRQTGRKHSADVVAADVRRLRETGVAKVNIDLIAGLPGQTASSWAESLDWVERLGAGHVSVYMLEVDEESRLGREILSSGTRYGAGRIPADGSIAEFYESAVERLAAMGIERYEISNFARPGEESVHNLKYWRFEPYVGFGADAHSFDGVRRRENARELKDYLGRWRAGRPFRVEESAADFLEEQFFVGLRLMEGIEAGSEAFERFGESISRLTGEGLLEADGRRLRLTPRGVLLSNEVFQEFINE